MDRKIIGLIVFAVLLASYSVVQAPSTGINGINGTNGINGINGTLDRSIKAGVNGSIAGLNETWQTLTDDTGAINTQFTPFPVVMNTTGLTNGTGNLYLFEYYVFYNSSATATGINLQVDYTGTNLFYYVRRVELTTGTTAVNGIADSVGSSGTGQLMEGWELNTDNPLGYTSGVELQNTRQFATLQGFVKPTSDGNLVLMAGSEVNGSAVRVLKGTTLILRKVG